MNNRHRFIGLTANTFYQFTIRGCTVGGGCADDRYSVVKVFRTGQTGESVTNLSPSVNYANIL